LLVVNVGTESWRRNLAATGARAVYSTHVFIFDKAITKARAKADTTAITKAITKAIFTALVTE